MNFRGRLDRLNVVVVGGGIDINIHLDLIFIDIEKSSWPQCTTRCMVRERELSRIEREREREEEVRKGHKNNCHQLSSNF